MQHLKDELKALIIETLDLEDVTPEDVKDDAPLFVEGLGLDSIDALEIGVALQKKYRITFNAKGEGLKEHFYSVSTMAQYIHIHRKDF
jgi:acyl carrier protein